jgi:hypothetical protein
MLGWINLRRQNFLMHLLPFWQVLKAVSVADAGEMARPEFLTFPSNRMFFWENIIDRDHNRSSFF